MKRIPITTKSFHKPLATRYFNKILYCTQNTEAKDVKKYPKFEKANRELWNDIIPSILSKRDIRTPDDCKTIRSELLHLERQITSVTVDSIVLNFCISTQNYEMANSYMDFLKQENIKPNLATLGKYFRLYYLSNSHSKGSNKLDIINLYKEIRQNYKVLDSTTCENIILALSVTSYWRDCLKLLEETKITAKPSSIIYSVIAGAAFRNNDDDVAWQLLTEAVDNNRKLADIPFVSYVEHYGSLLSRDAFQKKLETLFEFFKLHGITCTDKFASKISSFKDLNLKTVEINKSPICPQCKQQLDRYVLSEEVFNTLKTSIIQNVIVGKNVFYKTTPDELDRFKQFIKTMPKYDVVIDGLNVAYSYGVKQSAHMLSAHVAIAVKYFVDKRQRVLLLGRTHMSRWPARNWTYIKQNADCFLAQTLSQDDPYLLYCALHSGLNTAIVSKDLMRGHAFRLKNPHLKRQFNQWLAQNQLQIRRIDVTSGKIYFKFPLPYLRIAQKQGSHWHIPYEGDENENKWLCINV